MNGFEMLLKSLGVDPQEVLGTIQGMAEFVKNCDTRLSTIEKQNSEILEALKNDTCKGNGK